MGGRLQHATAHGKRPSVPSVVGALMQACGFALSATGIILLPLLRTAICFDGDLVHRTRRLNFSHVMDGSKST